MVAQEAVHYFAPTPKMVVAWSPASGTAAVAHVSGSELLWPASPPPDVTRAFVFPVGEPEFITRVVENSWDSATLKPFAPSVLLLIRTGQRSALSVWSAGSTLTFGLEATDVADRSTMLKTIVGAQELKTLTGVDGPRSWAQWKAQAGSLQDARIVPVKNGRDTEWLVELPVAAAEWEQIMRRHYGFKDSAETPVLQQPPPEGGGISTSVAGDERMSMWIWIGIALIAVVLAGWYAWKRLKRTKFSPTGQQVSERADDPIDPAKANTMRELAKSVWEEVSSSVQGEMEARGSSAESKYLSQTCQFSSAIFERHWLKIVGGRAEARQLAESALGLMLRQIDAANVEEAKRRIANSKQLDKVRMALKPADSTEAFLESLEDTFEEAATVPSLKQQIKNNEAKVARYDDLEQELKQSKSDLRESQADNKTFSQRLEKLENVKTLLEDLGKLGSLFDDSWQAIRGLYDRDEQNPEVVSAMAVLLQRGLAGLAIAMAKGDVADEQLHGGNLFRLSRSAAEHDLQHFKNLASRLASYQGEERGSSGGHVDKYFIERLKKTLRDYYGLEFKYQLVAALPQSHGVPGGLR